MKNEISDTWSDQQKLEKQISGRYETYEILIKKITFSNIIIFSNWARFFNFKQRKRTNEHGSTELFLSKNCTKTTFSTEKIESFDHRKSSKISFVYFVMETSKNLFGFTEIDAGNKVDSTLSLRRLERNLKSTYPNKVSTPIRQCLWLPNYIIWQNSGRIWQNTWWWQWQETFS